MNKSIIILLLLGSTHAGICQEKESNLTFYPLNIPYLLFNRYQTSLEVGVNRVDHLLLSGHFNRQLSYREGSGWGAEIQYRLNTNRDSNVEHKTRIYYGPFLEYDKVSDNYFDSYLNQMVEENVAITNLGLINGFNINLNKATVLDIYYGIGLAKVKERSYYDTYSSTYPLFKVGFQLGFKL